MPKNRDTMNTPVLFVNSYVGSGIGDFGRNLIGHLEDENSHSVTYLETQPNWTNFIRNWSHIFRYRSVVIVNLGFTSYGKSAVRNFINFLFIGIAASLMRKDMRIILHDSPEITTARASGYRFFRIKRLGSAAATLFLRRTKIHVFSKALHNLLLSKYGFMDSSYHPFPCMKTPAIRKDIQKLKPLILSLGYVAPYKGLEILIEIKELNPEIEVIVAGGFHPILATTSDGKNYIDSLTGEMRRSGIEFSGYLTDHSLEKIIEEHRCVGILPYKMTSGSSYAAIFLIERGIPLIASDLEEFRALQQNGAGIKVTDRTPTCLSSKLNEILGDPNNYYTMVESNIAYCKIYSISNFVSVILNRFTNVPLPENRYG